MSTPEKPSRLAGLVATKGSAPRPLEDPQHATSPEAAPVPIRSPAPVVPAPTLGSKSLTLRLPEPEYERLRAYAFANRKTHQTVLAEALKAYLDAMT